MFECEECHQQFQSTDQRDSKESAWCPQCQDKAREQFVARQQHLEEYGWKRRE